MAADDDDIRELLSNARTVAVVPVSPNPAMSSNRVARYLGEAGYTVYPVSSLDEVPEAPEIVYGFVGPRDAPPLVERAADVGARWVWLHEGIVSPEAEAVARQRDVAIVVDRSMEVEHKVLINGERRVYFMPM